MSEVHHTALDDCEEDLNGHSESSDDILKFLAVLLALPFVCLYILLCEVPSLLYASVIQAVEKEEKRAESFDEQFPKQLSDSDMMMLADCHRGHNIVKHDSPPSDCMTASTNTSSSHSPILNCQPSSSTCSLQCEEVRLSKRLSKTPRLCKSLSDFSKMSSVEGNTNLTRRKHAPSCGIINTNGKDIAFSSRSASSTDSSTPSNFPYEELTTSRYSSSNSDECEISNKKPSMDIDTNLIWQKYSKSCDITDTRATDIVSSSATETGTDSGTEDNASDLKAPEKAEDFSTIEVASTRIVSGSLELEQSTTSSVSAKVPSAESGRGEVNEENIRGNFIFIPLKM